MMENVNYFKVSELPVVDAVPEGATVLAYNEGLLLRVDGKNVGGGGKVVTIKQDGYDDFVAGIAPAVAAAPEPTYTCDTSYDEIVRMILAGEHFTGVLHTADADMGIVVDFAAAIIYVPRTDIPFVAWMSSPAMNSQWLFITADGVSVESPAGV